MGKQKYITTVSGLGFVPAPPSLPS